MPDIRYLTADDVLALAEYYMHALGYAPPLLRGNGRELLESAVNRAQTAAFYGGADIVAQAAALANGIALNHPFVDGNKRAAFVACLAFLDVNGLVLPPSMLEPLADMLISQHELTDRTQADGLLTAWLRSRL